MPLTTGNRRTRVGPSLAIEVSPSTTRGEEADHPYQPYHVDNHMYFELDPFYAEFAKGWDRRRLPMRYQPNDAALGVYRAWRDRNGGERQPAGPATR